MKKMRIIAAALLGAAVCGCSGTGEQRVTPVEYSGETSFRPAAVNSTVSKDVDVDGIEINSLNISRHYRSGDNYSLSFDLDIPEDNPAIAGAIARYLGEVMGAFNPGEENEPVFLGIDSVAPKTPEMTVAYADSAVRRFADVIVPQAQSDSVPGIDVSVTVRPVYANESYITYAMYSTAYLGGANAMTDFFLQTYDSGTGLPMNFYTLVPAEKQEAVRAQLIAVIAASNGQNTAQYLASVNQWIGAEKGSDWTVSTFPVYHVGLSSQGYVFCYPKYSIAPGSEGVGVYVVPAE